MAQRTPYQEPTSVLLGGTGLRVPNGVLAGSTASALKQVTGTDDYVLRSNGSAWEYALSGRLIQVVHALYGTQVLATTTSWIPTGLTAQITPKRSDSKIIVVAKQNGVGRLSNNTLGVGNFRLVWNGNPNVAFGFPFTYQGGTIFYNLGLGNATCFVTVTPGNANVQTFATQVQNQNGSSSIVTQWGNLVSSSMLLLEVAPV